MTIQVNGWEQHYGDKSFLYQCKDRFGADRGEQVWEECNLAFDRLPLAAIIDHEIFWHVLIFPLLLSWPRFYSAETL